MHVIDTGKVQPVEPAGHFGGLTSVDVIGPDHAQHFTIQISRGPVGSGAEMHFHPESEQIFFILEGELTFRTEAGETVVAGPGMAVYFAPKEAHATLNEGSKEVVSLVITSPHLG